MVYRTHSRRFLRTNVASAWPGVRWLRGTLLLCPREGAPITRRAAASAPGAIDLDRCAFPDASGRVPRDFPVRRTTRCERHQPQQQQLPAGDAAASLPCAIAPRTCTTSRSAATSDVIFSGAFGCRLQECPPVPRGCHAPDDSADACERTYASVTGPVTDDASALLMDEADIEEVTSMTTHSPDLTAKVTAPLQQQEQRIGDVVATG
ncbi:hypothetical protein HPB50_020711 [Hyalomma asiaticum]|uniref:Uncharacterized protein n=1 Tax=Hyalomma asiaticum TaxID=266040 RepID=A0ACB7TJD7_HYAAI|nr:hypothetical protein HPB50_020711 [Hyalomma asiaticum]